MQRMNGAIVIAWRLALLAVASVFSGPVLAAPRLDSVDTAELKVPLGHSSVITSLALSPDGKWLLSGSWDDSVRLWDMESGREIYRFDAPRSGINSVAISPDGKRMYAAGSDNVLRVWSLETGALLRTMAGHRSFIQAIAVSPNGEWLATGGGYDPPDMQLDNTVRIWDANTGRLMRELSGHSQAVMAVRFLSGGREIVSASLDGSIRVWRAADGKLLRRLEHGSPVRSIAFSRDEAQLVTGGGRYEAGVSDINDARLWDFRAGKVLRHFGGHAQNLSGVAISSDGRQILTASFDGTVRLWSNGANPGFVEVLAVQRPRAANRAAVFSGDGNSILIAGDEGVVRRWNVTNQRFDVRLGGEVAVPRAAVVSPDKLKFASANSDGTVRLFTIATGAGTTWALSRTDSLASIVFSPDSAKLLTSAASRAQLWDAQTGRLLQTYESDPGARPAAAPRAGAEPVYEMGNDPSTNVNAASFSASGARVATASADGIARVFETDSGRLSATLVHSARRLHAVLFSPDEQFLVTGAGDNKVRLWDIKRQRMLWEAGGAVAVSNGLGGTFMPGINSLALSADGSRVFAGSDDGSVRVLTLQHGETVGEFHVDGQSTSLELSADGSRMLIGGGRGGVQILNAATGSLTRRLTGHTDWVSSATYLPDGLIASTSGDGTLRIWREDTGSELAAIVSFRDRESVVVDPDGRFDAPQGGESSPLYWVVGRETIELDQLKERFFVPGLLARKMSSEQLPSVASFGQVALHPRVEVIGDPAVDSDLVIKLSNRGGGIGPVRLKLNGKEIAEDARPRDLDPNAARAEIHVSLQEYRSRLRDGRDNALEVQAFNQEGYLRSRGGTYFASPDSRTDEVAPKLWVVVVGVSNYSQPSRQIDLKFAAKDAADIAYALELGGAQLFGVGNIDINLLASGQRAERLPTKQNIKAAFERLGAARSEDVVVVYFSGHGLSFGGEYFFPTQEVDSLDLSDPGIRASRTISGREIAAWLKTDAEKQAVVLDTCAAGAFESSLTVERSVPTDQVRAIDRMKDRAGLYVLIGAAADRVSYEATPYRQGLLTHAILKAMRGAMLREDKFVNVAPLMDYAVDEVVKLARGVGGVQKPYVATPKGQTRSFDIGLLDSASRQRVPLRTPKMLVLRPVLLHESGADDLALGDALTDAIREMESKSAEPAFVFVDADRMAGAVKPTGLYKTDAGHIEVRLVLAVNDARKQITVNCAQEKNLTSCASSLVAAIAAESGWTAAGGP